MVSTNRTKEFQPRIPVLTGVTAGGKTALAIEIARERSRVEIINCDRLLFYRFAKIGTAKPTDAELATIPHHLIDFLDPDKSFDAKKYIDLVEQKISELHSKNTKVLLVGGSGFYLKSLIDGMWAAGGTDLAFRDTLKNLSDVELMDRLNARLGSAQSDEIPQDRYRRIRLLEILDQDRSIKSVAQLKAMPKAKPNPTRVFQTVWIDRDVDELNQRIAKRTQEMLKQGWIEETQQIQNQWRESEILKAVGYKQIVEFLDGIQPSGRRMMASKADLESEIILSTRQLAKKQRTFFKGQFPEATRLVLDKDTQQLKEILRICL